MPEQSLACSSEGSQQQQQRRPQHVVNMCDSLSAPHGDGVAIGARRPAPPASAAAATALTHTSHRSLAAVAAAVVVAAAVAALAPRDQSRPKAFTTSLADATTHAAEHERTNNAPNADAAAPHRRVERHLRCAFFVVRRYSTTTIALARLQM